MHFGTGPLPQVLGRDLRAELRFDVRRWGLSPEFRFYEGRSEGPQRPERDGPALLQGGGVA